MLAILYLSQNRKITSPIFINISNFFSKEAVTAKPNYFTACQQSSYNFIRNSPKTQTPMEFLIFCLTSEKYISTSLSISIAFVH